MRRRIRIVITRMVMMKRRKGSRLSIAMITIVMMTETTKQGGWYIVTMHTWVVELFMDANNEKLSGVDDDVDN